MDLVIFTFFPQRYTYGVFPTGVDGGGVPPLAKNLLIPPTLEKLITPPLVDSSYQKLSPPLNNNFHVKIH